MSSEKPDSKGNLNKILYEIIFEAETPAGKSFDVILIGSIILSVFVVMLGSINSVHTAYGNYFYAIEWFFTILFTVEYILRLYCVGHRLRYAKSFFGIIDLLAVLPTYLGWILPGNFNMSFIRVLRVLRIFRVLKLAKYLSEADLLVKALRASFRKIFIFLFTVLTLVTFIGSLMYIVEGHENGFTSIPRSIYWAIVTMTTVGYGDIAPVTNLSQTIASVVMILGYGIIAVPTGIVTVEMSHVIGNKSDVFACPECGAHGHDSGAKFCKYCGTKL